VLAYGRRMKLDLSFRHFIGPALALGCVIILRCTWINQLLVQCWYFSLITFSVANQVFVKFTNKYVVAILGVQ